MTIRNSEVADLLDLLGSLSELDGAVVFKVLAYRKAAERIRAAPESVERMAAEGRLTDLPDIGATIATKVDEIRATGTMAALERLRAIYPDGIVEVMAVPGVGPKTAACVLLFALERPALPVDTHVERVSKRLGLVPPKMPADRTHAVLEAMLEPDEVYAFHVDLIQHGRRTCHARGPRCEVCPLEARCPKVGV